MTFLRTITIVAVVWIAVIAALFWEKRNLSHAERALDSLIAQATEVQGRIRALTERAEQAREMGSALSLAIERLQKDRKAKESSKTDGDSDFRATVGRVPDLRRLYLKGFVADLDKEWGLLFRQLNLSSEQIAQFVGIQTRLEETKLDLAALAANEGLPATDSAIAAQLRQADNASRQALHELLGDPDFATYHSYAQDTAAITLVNDLAGFGSPGTEPLSDTQAEQLTQILADASTRRANGWVNYGTVDWQTVMPQVQTVLTPSQYDAMQMMELEKLAQWQRDIQLYGHP